MSEQEKRRGNGWLSVVAIAMMFGIGYVENKKCEAKLGDCSLSAMWKGTREVVFGPTAEELEAKRRDFMARNRLVETELVEPKQNRIISNEVRESIQKALNSPNGEWSAYPQPKKESVQPK